MKKIKFTELLKSRVAQLITLAVGLGALIWFLIRVIPKPSRAFYPCQRAAFPLASAFVIWLIGLISSYFGLKHLGRRFASSPWITAGLSAAIIIVTIAWFTILPSNVVDTYALTPAKKAYKPAVGYDWTPDASNQPIGVARGIFPGRVVMSRNPEATKWAGNWKLKEDQWWLDENTDKEKVYDMLSVTIQELTGAKNDKKAWAKLFKYFNQTHHQLSDRGYQEDEVIAIKVNLNNSNPTMKKNGLNASPQMVLAMVRQLVNVAKVPQDKIIIYDARRNIFQYMLNEIWNEFEDVRFLQQDPPFETQINPAYGTHKGLEGADWVGGMSYSAGNYNKAKLIPRQIKEATYIINMALLKLHSYPYNYMAGGDEGQTGITMCGKNHCGSILGTAELHPILNTKKLGVKNAYSPLVDLSASPHLGGKSLLFVVNGLYAGRKHSTYPLHFPNPPFNNKTEPYENPEWPSCILASLDQVAIESVGLDIMYAQSKNNTEPTYHDVPRIMVRENASDFLKEMALADNPPSGTNYMQAGKPVKSLGVHEHWDDDETMRYSRNLDPENGKGIEFIYIPLGTAKKNNN